MVEPQHISERVRDALIADDWQEERSPISASFRKRLEAQASAGSLSDGARIVELAMDVTGRWLERIDGWGDVEREVDLRNHTDAAAAISAALT